MEVSNEQIRYEIHGGDSAWNTGLVQRGDSCLNDTRGLVETIEKERRDEVTKCWKGTMANNGTSATKRAFLFTQLPEEWQPSNTTHSQTGLVTADPVEVLMAETKKLGKLWEAGKEKLPFGFSAPWGGCEALEP